MGLARPVAVLDAPSNLGLRPLAPGHIPGVWRLPDALRAQGLIERLGATDAGRFDAPPYTAEPELSTTFRNGLVIGAWTKGLAGRVHAILTTSFPLVLGGDCSILLGPMLALKRRGSFGLMFVDGYTDYCDPREASDRVAQTVAGRDLALVTGRGPDVLTNIDDLAPYVREEHTAILGYSIAPEYATAYHTTPFLLSGIHRFDVEQVRRNGAAVVAERAVQALAARSTEQFWIHLDADVLHQSVMPAVDSPNPNGLQYDQLIALLSTLVGSGCAVGMDVTIFDPDLDPFGRYANELADALVSVLR
jgi:arginase